MPNFRIDERGYTFNAEGREVELSPAMQRLVRALNTHGYIDPSRDFGRGRGTGVNTVVALMKRGILREAKGSWGRHEVATTPAQVEEEAYAEDARRDGELDAYMADNTNWVQCGPGGDLDVHTRQTRDGQTVLIVQQSFRYWHVTVGDSPMFTAAGDWREVRQAADRFEREQAWDDEVTKADDAFNCTVGKGAGTGTEITAEDGVHLRGAVGTDRVFGRVLLTDGKRIKVAWPGSVGWHAADELELHSDEECMTVSSAIGPDYTGGAFTEAVEEGWGQPDGMLGALEADLPALVPLNVASWDDPLPAYPYPQAASPVPRGTCMRMDGEHATHGYARYGQGCYVRLGLATTPAEARTGVSDRTAAARTALAKLHLEIHDAVIPHYDDRNRIRELLRIIEQALREQAGRRDAELAKLRKMIIGAVGTMTPGQTLLDQLDRIERP